MIVPWVKETSKKRHGELLEFRNIVYLDCNGKYTTVYISQNSLNYTIRRVSFIVCKVYLNKLDFKNKFNIPKKEI